ncbi:MAG TPA: DUF3105 domain-containing protein [Nitrospirales bacterium]
MKILLFILGGAFALAVVAAAAPSPAPDQKPGQEFPSLGNAHIQRLGETHVPYNSDPPTSGPHMPSIAPWGMYDQPIPKEYQVHNLEDGGVLLQYSCPKGCPELIKKLQALLVKYKKRADTEKKYLHLVIAPYPQMDSRLALTAWTRLDKLDDFDEPRVDRFIEAYVGIDHHKK